MATTRKQKARVRNLEARESTTDLITAYQNLLTSRAAVIKELEDNNADPAQIRRLKAQQGRDKATLKKLRNEMDLH